MMKSYLNLFLLGIILLIASFGRCKFTNEIQPNTLVSADNPFYGKYEIPAELNLPLIQDIPNYRNKDSLVNFLQNNADDFSWRTFVAICWPSDLGGNPDTNKTFAMEAPHVVFEHWMPSSRIYKKDGTDPQQWHHKDSSMKVVSFIFSELRTIPKLNTLEKREADHHRLIDQHGNPTYYQIYYNRVAYDYVYRAGLFNKQGQKKFIETWPAVTKGIKVIRDGKEICIEKEYQRAYFSIGNSLDSTRIIGDDTCFFIKHSNSTILKTAWRMMTPEDDKSRYYIRKSVDDQNRMIEMGLVGIHIAQKVSEATQWIWSSFEHMDNAPNSDSLGLPIVEPNVKYSYFNKDVKDTSVINKPNPSNSDSSILMRPNQIVRVNAILNSTQKINEKYRNKIKQVNDKSVWQYYQLIGTQWPFDPALFTQGNGYTPPLLASTVLESYEQKTSSCMGCHSQSRFLRGDTSVADGYGFNADFIWGLTNVK